jgi:hypothetical protein
MERERSPKRRRAVDFRLKFSQVQALKSFFENVHNNMRELEVRVEKGALFEGISVEAMNESHSVILMGKLAAEVELNVPQASFWFVVRSLINLLRANARQVHFVDFLRYEGDDRVRVVFYEPGRADSGPTLEILTLDRDSSLNPLQDIAFTHYVEVQLEAMKAALRTANLEEIEKVTLQVRERSAEDDPDYRTLWFVLRFSEEHKTGGEYAWRSRIKVSQDSATVMAVSDRGDEAGEQSDEPEPYNLVYSETFHTEHLWNFTRAMDRMTATFRLCAQRPLLLEYPLGDSGTDYLRFVLAPTL